MLLIFVALFSGVDMVLMRATALMSATGLLMRAAVGMLTALFAGFAGALGIVFEIAAAMLAALALAGMRTVIFVWHSLISLMVPASIEHGSETHGDFLCSLDRWARVPTCSARCGRANGCRPVKEPGEVIEEAAEVVPPDIPGVSDVIRG